jgi:hypothetical protein
MAVTRKPTEETIAHKPLPEDSEFQRYLSKGGSSAHSDPEPEVKDVRFTLVVPGPLCQEVDQLLQQLPFKKARHQWILEAMTEKVKRDQKAAAKAAADE